MADELLRLPYALRLSRAAVRNIKANLAISVVLKARVRRRRRGRRGDAVDGRPGRHGASVIVIANALGCCERTKSTLHN